MVKLFGAAVRRHRNVLALAVACGLGSGLALATPAAASTNVTFDFVGKCSDCQGYGLGQLTLTNYTPGQAITAANFVSFSYTTNMVDLSIDAAHLTALAGLLDPSNLTSAHVLIGTAGQTFESSGTGFWAVSTPGAAGGDGGGGGGGGGGFIGPDLASLPQPPLSFFEGADLESLTFGSVVEDYGPSFAFQQLVASVPEPAAWTMMLVGFGGLGAMARRRRTALACA